MAKPLVSRIRDLIQIMAYKHVSLVDPGDEARQPDGRMPGRGADAGLWIRAMACFFGGFVAALVLVAAALWSQPAGPAPPPTTTAVAAAAAMPAGPGSGQPAELYFSDTTDPPPLLNQSCGASVAEARQAGCVFDMLSTAWTPAACVDAAVTAEFLATVTAAGAWPYYHDKAGTRPLRDLAALQAGEWVGRELWSTMQLHQHHCLFTWRRMHIAYNGGPPVDTVSRGLRHTKHCARMLMHRDDPDRVSGVQSVYFRSC